MTAQGGRLTRNVVTDNRGVPSGFAYPVAIITVRDKDRENGMTAAWLTQVSISPRIYAVSVGLTRYTHELMQGSGTFGINFLSDEQADLANHFGKGSGRKTDRLDDPRVERYEAEEIDCPMIGGCVLNIECRITGSHTYGDHTIFVGEALRIESDDEMRPLLYSSMRYYSLGNFLLDR
jgi:flavin reductase (DIM6/NTAB) family NADH-FMN oxidoreductase RutF